MANRTCYGYDTSETGELTVNEEQAKAVRWIFERYLAEDSFGKIAKGLEKQSICSPTGKAKWNREAISKLLSNEKYVGMVLLQETMSFCGMQFSNDGKLKKILVKNYHEAIISAEDFELVQRMKQKRSKSQDQSVPQMTGLR